MNDRDLPFLSGGEGRAGHMPEIHGARLAFSEKIAREAHPFAKIRAPYAPVYSVNDPVLLHELLVEKARSVTKSGILRFSLYPLVGDGLFTSEGELWKAQRKLMAPLFHPNKLRHYAGDMVACTERLLSSLSDRQEISFSDEMVRVTMSVAAKTLFGDDAFLEAKELSDALTVALEWASHNAPSRWGILHMLTARALRNVGENLPRTLRGPMLSLAGRARNPVFYLGKEGVNLRRALRVLDAKVGRLIAERRAHPRAEGDLLGELLAARDEGKGMSDKQVRDEILTLFVAGHETTATGLAWTMQLLCKHKEIYAGVEREVDALGRAPTWEDLEKLPLTLRVFKEALRLYPPVYAFGRQTLEPMTLGGIDMARDTILFLCPYALHRRPDLWPSPDVFAPERFTPENENARARLAWLPFGAGPRVCIGNHFAMMEAVLILATLLSAARFTLVQEELPMASATLRPAGPMRMRMQWRAGRSAQRPVGAALSQPLTSAS